MTNSIAIKTHARPKDKEWAALEGMVYDYKALPPGAKFETQRQQLREAIYKRLTHSLTRYVAERSVATEGGDDEGDDKGESKGHETGDGRDDVKGKSAATPVATRTNSLLEKQFRIEFAQLKTRPKQAGNVADLEKRHGRVTQIAAEGQQHLLLNRLKRKQTMLSQWAGEEASLQTWIRVLVRDTLQKMAAKVRSEPGMEALTRAATDEHPETDSKAMTALAQTQWQQQTAADEARNTLLQMNTQLARDEQALLALMYLQAANDWTDEEAAQQYGKPRLTYHRHRVALAKKLRDSHV